MAWIVFIGHLVLGGLFLFVLGKLASLPDSTSPEEEARAIRKQGFCLGVAIALVFLIRDVMWSMGSINCVGTIKTDIILVNFLTANQNAFFLVSASVGVLFLIALSFTTPSKYKATTANTVFRIGSFITGFWLATEIVNRIGLELCS